MPAATRMTQGLNRVITTKDVSTNKSTIALENEIQKVESTPDNNQPIEKEKVDAKVIEEVDDDAGNDQKDELDVDDVEKTASSSKETNENSSDEDEGDDEDSPEEKSKRKRKSRNERKIERLSKTNAELSQQLATALEYLQKTQNNEEKKTVSADADKPKREEFEDPDEYEDAVIQWAKSKTKKELAEAEEQKAMQDQAKKAQAAWLEKVERGNDKYDDFDDVVLDNNLSITIGMSQAIISLDNGEDVAYYLGKNREIAKNISKLTDIQAGIELAKIAENLKKTLQEELDAEKTKIEEEKAKRKLSKAPDPIKPASSKRSADIVNLDNETPEQYRLRRLKEMKYKAVNSSIKIK